MNTDISGIEPEQPKFPAKETSVADSGPNRTGPGRSGGVLGFLALLFAIAALAATGWMWWQGQATTVEESQRLSSELARLESNNRELSVQLTQLREGLRALESDDPAAKLSELQQGQQTDRSNIERVEQAINEQTTLARSLQATADSLSTRLMAAESALGAISARELNAAGELDIAEVDFLLRLASERLKLFSDPVSADEALEIADSHLAALDNPMYLGVRQEIAVARRELAAVKIPDYLDLTGRLEAVQQEIAALPFRSGEQEQVAASQAEDLGWWDKVKSVFSSLVTVRRSTQEENRRISLQDKDYIRQGVWLQLEVARLALMRRDQAVFRASLGQARETLSTWFDSSDSHYSAAIQGIDGLSAAQVRVVVPDITGPWSSLRQLRSPRAQPAAPSQRDIPDNPTDAEGLAGENGEG